MKNEPCCKLCGSNRIFDFFQLPPVPTQDGVMMTTKVEALAAPKGQIDLRFCKDCGYIRNEGYDPSKISFDDYDFSNDHSPIFKAFVNELCDRLVEDYDLKGKTILDIGCGDGVFLNTICEKGNNKGIGIDPGFDHSKRKLFDQADVTFSREYYSEQHRHLKPDFMACRLVLDLLEDQTEFLKMIRANLEDCPDTILYVEVPNALYTFEERIIWNVVYEHGAWYTPESFAFQFEQCGFEVLNVSPCWNDEFLGIEVRPRAMDINAQLPNKANIQKLHDTVLGFNQDFESMMSFCNDKLDKIRKNNTKTIAWGAGARAVTFFNLFDLEKEIPVIVDINNKRHGKYLPGSGHEIVAPEFIIDYAPDLVLITNPTYAEEIKTQVKELGINPDFWVL